VRVVILAEVIQLSLQVAGIPEERLVKKFPLLICCAIRGQPNRGLRRFSSSMAFAPPGPRSLAVVVNRWMSPVSRPFMAGQKGQSGGVRGVSQHQSFDREEVGAGSDNAII